MSMSLFEQYRPVHLDEIAGQDEAVTQVKRVLSRSWGKRSWWITGDSGVGKTTLAYAIAREGADDFFIQEIDAGELTPSALHDLERGMQYRAMSGRPGKAYIVNEAHGLRKDTIRMLLVLLERLPNYVCMIFTTTQAGEQFLFGKDDSGDTAPLVSRCVEIDLCNDGPSQKAMASRAREIAVNEGIDGLPDEVYVKALSACKGNMRMLLQKIESGRFITDARGNLEKELDRIKSTKGEKAEKRRQQINGLLSKLESI